MKIKFIKDVNDFMEKFSIAGLVVLLILYLLSLKFDSIESIALWYLIIYSAFRIYTYYKGKSAIIVFPKKIKEYIRSTSYYKSKIKNDIILFLAGLIMPVFGYLLLFVCLGLSEGIAENVIMLIAYTLIIFMIYFFIKGDLPNIDKILIDIFAFNDKDEKGNMHAVTRDSNVPYFFKYNISFGKDRFSPRYGTRYGICFISGALMIEKSSIITSEQLERIREKYYFINIMLEIVGDKIIINLHNKYRYNKSINSKYVVGTIISMCELANDIVNYKEME